MSKEKKMTNIELIEKLQDLDEMPVMIMIYDDIIYYMPVETITIEDGKIILMD